MKNIILFLTIIAFSLQCSASVVPLTMVITMNGAKRTTYYDPSHDEKRFETDVEVIVQKVWSLVQSKVIQDIRPWLKEELIDALHKSTNDRCYTIEVTIKNNREYSVKKRVNSYEYHLVSNGYYYHTPHIAMQGLTFRKPQLSISDRIHDLSQKVAYKVSDYKDSILSIPGQIISIPFLTAYMLLTGRVPC